MSTIRTTMTDDELLPSPAGAQSGAGQPAIPSWLAAQRDEYRLTTHLSDAQRGWVVAVCDAARARGAALSPSAVLRAAVGRLMQELADPQTAAEALRSSS